MASKPTSDLGPTAPIEVDGGGRAAVIRLPRARPQDHAETPSVRRVDERGRLLRRLLLGADVAALCAAFLGKEMISGFFRSADLPLLLLSIPLWVLLAYSHRLYHLDSHRADYRAADEIGPVLQMATLWSWSTLLALWLARPQDSAVTRVALFWALTVVLLMTFRSIVRAFARRRDWYRQDALVIGPAAEAAEIVRKIQRHPEWGIKPRAYVDVADTESHPAGNGHALGMGSPSSAELIAVVRELGVDRVMLTPALSESRGRAELVCELAQMGVHVDLVPSWSNVVGARLDLHEMEGMPLLTVPRAGLRRSAFGLKRALDLAAGTLALVVLAPVMAACAIAIKLDSPGPVFFRQRRVGRNDRRFELVKFRSMCADADVRKDEVARLNLHGGGNESGMFKVRQDPRLTRVGSKLRRYSLDELPQLFNILRGDMSFVGPRPLIESEDRQVEGRFRRRLGLTPGLTGLWQAHGRSEIPFEDMVSLDYLYVTNWSLWGDMKLLMRTASAVLRGGGAY